MSVTGHTVIGRRKLGDMTNGKAPGNLRKSTAKNVKPSLALSSEERNYSQLILEDNTIDNHNMTQHERPNPVSPAVKEDYSNLLMEKASLLRILAAQNQIIEHNNVELQKLRMVVQQLQLQNLQLAQANTQMLAELNMGKDKLKILKHELTCTEAALRGKGFNKEENNQQPAGDVVVGDESHLAPFISKLLSSSTPPNELVEDKGDTRRRSTRKQCSNSKSQECEHKAPLNINGLSNDVQHPQLVSLAAPTEVENQNNDEKSVLVKAETGQQFQTRKSLAPQESQVMRRSSRRQSGEVKLEAYESKLPINLNDSSEEEQQVKLVTSANTNFHPASSKGKKQICNNAEMAKHPLKRKISAPSQGVEVPCSKLRQSRNTEPGPCQRTCVPKLLVNVNSSVENLEHIQLVSLDDSVGQVPPSEGQVLPTTLGRRKLSAPSQSLDLPRRSSVAGRPSRRATIGVSYKEIPLNIKMRRNT